VFLIFPGLDLPSQLLVNTFVFLSHWLIDGTNLVQQWMRWVGQRDQVMVRVVIDQTLHLLVLAIATTAATYT
jgi:hypothetical protein